MAVHRLLDITIGNIFGKDITCRECPEPCDYYQPGVLVVLGHTAINLFKKFLLPGGLCGAVPLIKPEPIAPDTPVNCNNDGIAERIIRPSELPIYVNHIEHKPEPLIRDENSIRSQMEDGFAGVRKTFSGVTDQYQMVHDKISHVYNTGLAHTKGSIDYLHQDENLLPRIGTIVGGGFLGFLLAIRGGKFKRFVYMSTGAGVMAAICYPEGAKDTLNSSKHYINIGYNFVYGVKPGDANQKEIKWPEFPTIKLPDNFSDFVVLVKDTGGAVISSIGSLTGDLIKGEEINKENKLEVKKETKDK